MLVLARLASASGCSLSPHIDGVYVCHAAGAALRLGPAAPVEAETSVEALVTLEHEELLKLAPEVQGGDRLRAWREEKEVHEQGRRQECQ